ncbi:hypothetical protein [Natronobacterium texcoconense]|uniref:Histidine kinase n=1 Tax=Natronobacterium texcoconense TaxID=1095778 RepID=A0A1H1A597_NATTX|nr:hypothetical protein [Natronobacterium texcoconense]SDQ34691.1 hypothetical protein SAMN04489842_0567 [Natronobacterium texcoconense]
MDGGSDGTASATSASAFGLESPLDWTVGGALGGAIGAAVFGLLVWLFDPEVVAVAIPAIYGLEPVGVVGWGIHVAHGIVLGLVFGFLMTRQAVLEFAQMDVETAALSRSGMWVRTVAAGFVFGLTIWAILPLLVLPVWIDAIGTEAAGDFPATAVESLVGHVLFGTVLGLVFATTVDLRSRTGEAPIED